MTGGVREELIEAVLLGLERDRHVRLEPREDVAGVVTRAVHRDRVDVFLLEQLLERIGELDLVAATRFDRAAGSS